MMCVILLVYVPLLGTLPPYYVRPEPLYFTKHPSSATDYLGTPITLNCAFNAQTVASAYMFEMYWTFNGTKMNKTTTNSQSGQLELSLVLNETTAGRYQCVVQDGLFSIVSEVAELRLRGKYDVLVV